MMCYNCSQIGALRREGGEGTEEETFVYTLWLKLYGLKGRKSAPGVHSHHFHTSTTLVPLVRSHEKVSHSAIAFTYITSYPSIDYRGRHTMHRSPPFSTPAFKCGNCHKSFSVSFQLNFHGCHTRCEQTASTMNTQSMTGVDENRGHVVKIETLDDSMSTALTPPLPPMEVLDQDERRSREEASNAAIYHHPLGWNRLQTATLQSSAQRLMLSSQLMPYGPHGLLPPWSPDFTNSLFHHVAPTEPNIRNAPLYSPLLSQAGYMEYPLNRKINSGGSADAAYALRAQEQTRLNRAPAYNHVIPLEDDGLSLSYPSNAGYYYMPTAFPELLRHLRPDLTSSSPVQSDVHMPEVAVGQNKIASSSSPSVTHIVIGGRNPPHPYPQRRVDIFRCTICLKEYNHKSSIRSHLFRKHEIRSPAVYKVTD